MAGFTGMCTILDIHAKDSENRTINIEMQAHEIAEFAKRSAFYAFRLYIQSIGKGKKHAEIPPVISVNLLDFNLFPGFVYHRCFRLLDIKDPAVSMMDDIEFHFIELGKMNTPNSDNPLSLWIEFIRNSETLSEAAMKTLEKKRPVFKKAHKALTEISKDSKTRLAYDRRKSAIFFYERTLEQKFEDGRAEGKLEGKLETAKAMLLEGEPLEKIARITGLSIKEISKIQPE